MDKTCENCINVIFGSEGNDRTEPRFDYIECKFMKSKNPNTVEMVFEIQDAEKNAERCCLYDAGKCGECGAIIRNPSYRAIGMWEELACCSEECKDICQDAIDTEIKEHCGNSVF
jgi:hypothetical protein